MPAPLMDPDSSLDVLLDHNTFTWTQVNAHPLTAHLAKEYEKFQKLWFDVDTKETQHWTGILKGSALIVAADEDLDSLVDSITAAILLIVNNDREAPLYKLFFTGSKRPSEIKRPVLGGQLETMRGWIPLLKNSSHEVLQTLGAKVEQGVTTADAAAEALTVAKNKNREFRTMGERRALFDKFNAMQKLNHGKIAELPHTHPELQLPNTFAERFFKRGSRPRAIAMEGAAESSSEIAQLVAETEARLEELRARLDQALVVEKNEAEAKKTRAAKEAKLAEARELAKKAQEEVAAAEKALAEE